jgi:hypothetical protein
MEPTLQARAGDAPLAADLESFRDLTTPDHGPGGGLTYSETLGEHGDGEEVGGKGAGGHAASSSLMSIWRCSWQCSTYFRATTM